MNSMEMSFNARLENEAFARSAVGAFITPLNPTINELTEIKTIIAEAVSNAIIHGYNCNKECFVVIRVIVENRTVTLIVQDYGKGIEDIESVKKPFYTSLKELEHAGMGFTIMETFADSLEIESIVNIGTKLIIKKRLKDSSE